MNDVYSLYSPSVENGSVKLGLSQICWQEEKESQLALGINFEFEDISERQLE